MFMLFTLRLLMTKSVADIIAVSQEEICEGLNSQATRFDTLRLLDELLLAVKKGEDVILPSINAFSASCCTIFPSESGVLARDIRTHDIAEFSIFKPSFSIPEGGADPVLFFAMNMIDFEQFFTKAVPSLTRLSKPFVIVTCCEDMSMPWEYFTCHESLKESDLFDFLENPLLLGWYTQNWDVIPHSGKRIGFSNCANEIARNRALDSKMLSWNSSFVTKVQPIPIGFKTRISSTSADGSCTTRQVLKQLKDIDGEKLRLKDKVMKLLVTVSGAALKRDRRQSMMQELNSSVSVQFLDHHISQNELLVLMSRYMFVATPASHGQDTYRFWESLRVGSIPVLLTGPLDTLYKQFPCIILDSWGDIDDTKLLSWREYIVTEYGDRPFDKYSHMMTSSYWKEAIQQTKRIVFVNGTSGWNHLISRQPLL
jgi:hypothetical protein